MSWNTGPACASPTASPRAGNDPGEVAMFTLIDRQMIRGYFKAYAVCLTSLLSLYVVVDMFMNLEDFARADKGQTEFLRKIASYYGYRVFQIFDRLCEAILLLSAMFTVAWMQRHN